MNIIKKSALTALVGIFSVAILATAPAKAENNPFAAQDVVSVSVVGGDDKCGEGKCGEGKAKAKGKCGEGKCGEGKAKAKCGEGKKKAKGKCGEGKCGG